MRYFILFLATISFHTVLSQISSPLPPSTPITKTITFYAKDSVKITADTYFLKDISPTVLLCHQASFSRGEYIDTAKKLNALGFSCMAIDQRSGKEVNGIVNQTALDANIKKMNVGYAGAKKDVDAAIDHLYELNGKQPIILVGSSYSASLALWIGSENKKVKAIAVFSPGEYLKNMNLAEAIKKLRIPTFVTSSKRETEPVEKLLRFVKPDYITHFKPQVRGVHGSRAVWDSTEGYEAYWNAFKEFMLANK
ncbi:MAG: lysophospholipase [Flavobacteriaceae bacterium]|nr:lysophospholipase [Flavobacteriaceae bacterium]